MKIFEMTEMDAINIDKWRDLTAGLFFAYVDCYSKLNRDSTLNKDKQLFDSLNLFTSVRNPDYTGLYGSAYTIARELGIFYEESSQCYLNPSIDKLLNQPIQKMSIEFKKYMKKYAFNTEFYINKKVIHPTYTLAEKFSDQIFSLDDASKLTVLIPSSFLTKSTKDCLTKFLKRLVLADILEDKGENQYKFIDYELVKKGCTFSKLLPEEFLDKFIGKNQHKNVVLEMINRGEDVFENTYTSEIHTLLLGKNKIIYGAPGAGKSALVSGIVRKNYIRTVFHQETQYSDFIGCLKPHKDSTGSITYSFRKGPFIQILEKALLDQENHHFLVIEELNRANTAAVFGEIFQLLDRDDEGKSEYPILIQDEDLYDALKETLGSKHEFIVKRQLMIPSNLSIIATMNSSDQAVFPLDTAFKRRWIFEYLPIDFTNCATGEIPIHHAVLPNVEWKTLAQTINTVLVQLKVVEDKLIGPWFIKDSDLVEDQAEQTFIGKICSYLWDDALKYKNKDEIFKSDIHGYGELYQRYSDKKPIFSDKFMEMLQAAQDVDTDTSDKTEAE